MTDDQRQQAKQTVYGVIYGMGERALAEQLGVEQAEAAAFQDSFKARYPGLRRWLLQCVARARSSGVVETMSGRKRKIPDITSTSAHRRSGAERVAVNTRVQGSAADLVKTAMVRVEEGLRQAWPGLQPLRWCRRRKGGWRGQKGAWLLLQLHDELIFEVSGDDVVQAAQVVRGGMEGAVALEVPTPVRLKVGASWGTLHEFKL